jgi:predicted lipoprotein with Yx(FWY)xxD motif
MIKILLCAVACAVPLASLAEPPKIANGMVVDDDGMTLYTFDKDRMPGQSACTGSCPATWPAALADSYDKPSGQWSLIAAARGGHQWSYMGHPLYRFSGDRKPGQKDGDGFGGVWHIAKP